MKARLQSIAVLSVLPVIFLGTAAYMRHHAPAPVDNLGMTLLLVPDSLPASNPVVREWLDAAGEEGVHLGVIHDSEFLNPMRGMRLSEAVIVPDQIHRVCNDALVGALYSFAAAGGKLMIVYDACTYDLNNTFTKGQSRLSDLVGVSYALYDRYKTDCIAWSGIWGKAPVMTELEIPPGKYVAAEQDPKSAGFRAISLVDLHASSSAQPDTFILRRYQYGDVEYPSFRTEGEFTGTTLLRSTAGVVAGYIPHGSGTVLFANLPLGYLEQRTDGLLLHSFLQYFAVRMQSLPYLASVPDGVGGLIFNWHVDAHSALRYLTTLFNAGVFNNGPFSTHITAGPDVDAYNDGKGLNVEHSAEAQRLIHEFQAHGDVIGSHGGWDHNIFGMNVNDNNEVKYAPYITWNVDALRKVARRPITEYSAPVGNHPQWMTGFLENKGFNSYYFVGDSGMGPTRVYRDSGRDGDSIWAFPVLHLGKYAAMEEMAFDDLPDSEVRTWLDQVADFAVANHTARLIYTHPLGAVRYLTPLEKFLHHTRDLKASGKFRWYTMSGLAEFLNTRLQVQWNVTDNGGGNTMLVASVAAPRSLAHMTWILPRSLYREPKVESGNATIRGDGENWLIDAGNCRRLEVQFRNASATVQFAKDAEQ